MDRSETVLRRKGVRRHSDGLGRPGNSKGWRLLILSDSKAAIAEVIKAGMVKQGRTGEVRDATDLITRKCRNDQTWVKSLIGIEGNEAADEKAKKAAEG